MKELGFNNEQYMCMETVEAADNEGFRVPVANDRKGFGDIAAREYISWTPRLILSERGFARDLFC